MRDWDTRAMSGRSTLCPVGRHSARTPQPGAQGHSLDFGRILTTFLIRGRVAVETRKWTSLQSPRSARAGAPMPYSRISCRKA